MLTATLPFPSCCNTQDWEMKNNNGLITFDSIKECKELILDVEENLEPAPECSIFRVPKVLRKTNEKAYTPQVISIGPLHYGNPELAYMEKQKIRYMREFSERNEIIGETWRDDFIDLIVENEQRISNCYEEMPKFEKLKFVTMILYDAVFIIELFLRHNCEQFTYKSRLRFDIRLDLQLLENQLPYFILVKLYSIAFPNDNPYSFFNLSNNFLFDDVSFDGHGVPDLENVLELDEVKHFTDLRRHALKMRYSRCQLPKPILDIPCATKLRESGVKFKKVEGGCLLDIEFEKKKQRVPFPWLDVHVLKIPPIKVFDGTESLFRNLMALEQCHYPEETYICNYVYLMDCLINTEEDVNFLVEAGIIAIHVGDSAKVANLFNNICQDISLDEYCYYHLLNNLKEHNDNPWNHAVATLKRVYFNNLWTGTGTVAAILLLVLTLIQTICSVFQVV